MQGSLPEMSTGSKLDKLFNIIESGGNAFVRKAAAKQIGEIVVHHPSDLQHLLIRSCEHLKSKTWETRIAASMVIENLAKNTCNAEKRWSSIENEPQTCNGLSEEEMFALTSEKLNFESFEIDVVVKKGQQLLSSSGKEYDVWEESNSTSSSKEKMQLQRKNLKKKLGISEGALGEIDNTLDLISDEDLIVKESKTEVKKADELEIPKGLSARERNALKRKARQKSVVTIKEETKEKKIKLEANVDAVKEDEEDSESNWAFQNVVDDLSHDLLNPNWNIRHGCCLGLQAIFMTHGLDAGMVRKASREQNKKLQNIFMQDLVLRLISVLILDRFCDFVSDNIVSPVKEAAAQCLSFVIRGCDSFIIEKTGNALLSLCGSECWEVRHGGLIGLKYYIASNPGLVKNGALLSGNLYPIMYNALHDNDDDVRAVAADILTVILSEEELKNNLELSQKLLNSLTRLIEDNDDPLGSSIAPLISLAGKVLECLTVLTFPIDEFVEKLVSFYRNPLVAVRRVCIKISSKLVEHLDSSEKLRNLLRYAFQSILLESFEDIQLLSTELFSHLLKRLGVCDLKKECNIFLSLACTPLGSPFDKKYFLGPFSSLDLALDASGVHLIPESVVLNTRLFAAKAIAQLPAYYYKELCIKILHESQFGIQILTALALLLESNEKLELISERFKVILDESTIPIFAESQVSWKRFLKECNDSSLGISEISVERLNELSNSCTENESLMGLLNDFKTIIENTVAPIRGFAYLLACKSGAIRPFYFDYLKWEKSSFFLEFFGSKLADVIVCTDPSHQEHFIRNLIRMENETTALINFNSTSRQMVSVESALEGCAIGATNAEKVFYSLSHVIDSFPFINHFLADENHDWRLQSIYSISKVIKADFSKHCLYCLNFAADPNPLMRYRAVRGICGILKTDFMSHFVIVAKESKEFYSHTELSYRLFFIELVYYLLSLFPSEIMSFLSFFAVKCLALMNDHCEEIRNLASFCFSKIIYLIPLDKHSDEIPIELQGMMREERDFIEQLLSKKVMHYELPMMPSSVNLRSYQQEGIDWLAFLNKFHLHGVLADDMGLGKTLQTLCIISADHHNKKGLAAQKCVYSLVIAPSTVTGHWVSEVQRYFKHLKPLLCSGSLAEKQKALSSKSFDVMVASYETVRTLQESFKKIQWNYIVLDEGHVIKNPKTKLAVAVKNIPSKHRLVLTGTPIQNNILELWSIFDFLMPNFLGPLKTFNEKYVKPIQASSDAKCSVKDQEQAQKMLEKLHKQVLPFIMRRMKDDVLKDLPPKIIQDYYCELSFIQKRAYDDFMHKAFQKTNESDQKNNVFKAIQFLRKLVCHPALAIEKGSEHYKMLEEEMKQGDLSVAPKLQLLKDILIDCGIDSDAATSPHRVLIFAQFQSTLDVIENALFKAHLPRLSYLRLDGNVEASKRYSLVKQFNDDPSIDVLLLTTSIGGVGLNLTAADTVVFMEHDWNPMKDLQAMDRAHRLGQTRVVNVYRLIAKDTLEEKIMSLQQWKTRVANTVVNQQNASMNTMDTDVLLDLFEVNSSAKQLEAEKEEIEGPRKNAVDKIVEGLGELWNTEEEYQSFDMSDFIKKIS